MIHDELCNLSCPCGIHYICNMTLTCNGALHCICTRTSHFKDECMVEIKHHNWWLISWLGTVRQSSTESHDRMTGKSYVG